MTVLVDSDVLIEVTRARDSKILERWTALSESESSVFCSAISAAELWQGAFPAEHELLADLFRAMICIPVDAATGRKAGELLRKYRKSHGVELADALIAASAILSRAALWTRNRKHYPMDEISFF